MTLQDVSMILALPISGEPVCRSTDTSGWQGNMHCLLGKVPETKKGDAAGAPFSWIAKHFAVCPPELQPDSKEVKQHARAYLWYVVSRVLFAYCSGRNAPFL